MWCTSECHNTWDFGEEERMAAVRASRKSMPLTGSASCLCHFLYVTFPCLLHAKK